MSVKKLSINPDFFKMSKGKSKKKNAKTKTISSSLLNKTIKPNDIKKKLLQRIKEHQIKNREISKPLENSNIKTFHDEFKESMDYLSGVMEKRKKIRKKKTVKNNQITNSHAVQNKIQGAPPYGCLKNGNKPTFRQYQKTLKRGGNHSTQIPKLIIADKPQTMTHQNSNSLVRKNKLQNVKSKLSTVFTNPLGNINIPSPPPNKMVKQRNKTIRRKIKLGKIKNTVGILVKNKRTRKRIKRDMDVLKTTKLHNIKSYLKRHNLIKIGSAAPEDVLRKIYEDARLAGSIYNKNPDVLIHNYMQDN